MSNNYRRGADYERKIRDLLTGRGFFVIRAAGSHGICDLIALRSGWCPVLVQCKCGAARVSAKDGAELARLAHRVGGIALTCEQGPRINGSIVTDYVVLKKNDAEKSGLEKKHVTLADFI